MRLFSLLRHDPRRAEFCEEIPRAGLQPPPTADELRAKAARLWDALEEFLGSHAYGGSISAQHAAAPRTPHTILTHSHTDAIRYRSSYDHAFPLSSDNRVVTVADISCPHDPSVGLYPWKGKGAKGIDSLGNGFSCIKGRCGPAGNSSSQQTLDRSVRQIWKGRRLRVMPQTEKIAFHQQRSSLTASFGEVSWQEVRRAHALRTNALCSYLAKGKWRKQRDHSNMIPHAPIYKAGPVA